MEEQEQVDPAQQDKDLPAAKAEDNIIPAAVVVQVVLV
jgi:hypothetical protein